MLTVRGHLLPGIRRVHELSVLDLVVDVLVLIERECTGQAKVLGITWRHVLTDPVT